MTFKGDTNEDVSVGDASTISRPSDLEAILAEELYRPHRRGNDLNSRLDIIMSLSLQVWLWIWRTFLAKGLEKSSSGGRKQTNQRLQAPRWISIKPLTYLSWSNLTILKVRYFMRSWESFLGDSATPRALIEALKRVKPKPQDMIDKISQQCV